jgi:hypothetical protein
MRIQRPTITQIAEIKGDGAILTGSFSGSFTGEYNTAIISSSGQIADLGAGIVSGSSQIGSDISGSFTSTSASIASNIDNAISVANSELNDSGSTLQTNIDNLSSSLETRVTDNSVNLDDAVTRIGAQENFSGSLSNAITIDDQDLTVFGNLTVQGTQTSLDTATLNVADLNILVASGAADSAAANGAGLTVDGASATLTYASTGDKWVFNKVVDVPTSGLLINGNVVTATASELNSIEDKITNSGGFNQLTFKDVAGRINGSSNLTFDPFSFDLTHANGLASFDGGLDVNGALFTVSTDGDTKADSLGVGTAASGTTGEIRATGDITAYYSSDERLKENFTPLTGALDKVKAIGGYEFDWKDGIEDVVSKKGHDIGVKAQELQAQYPELVHERDNGYLAVDYIKLNAVLIEAVKELAAKVEELSK